MRASLKWLKDYVDIKDKPEELADKLTMAGIPVAQIEYLGQNIEKVVTGRLIEVSPHPNADKLLVCKVDIGEQVVTIVTGAKNVKQGDIVPVALDGAKLPIGKEIFAADFRGVISQGMLCSSEELNLDTKIIPPESRDGIYILPPDTPIGVNAREALGLDDVVFEFELTANRADCFSIVGIAREIAVLTGATLKKPMLNVRETADEKASALIDISINEPTLCQRFTARVLKDVKVGPSPLWLQHRLQAAGMRPINNIVDVTNFVMLEIGQPMHAYDYRLLSRHQIIVRKARAGEPLTTLDNVKRELNENMLVIADAGQAVGLAGVMGGLATEVTAGTQTVLLEAAAFNGPNIRRTSRGLGLRSEASGRFERGVDVVNVTRALDRAAKLLEDMGACKVCQGIVDKYPSVALPKQVTFTPAGINAHLGTDIPTSTMIDILKRLEFEVDSKEEQIVVTVPTWRADVAGPADISEEIARIYGFNNIASTTPAGTMTQGRQSYMQTIVDKIKTILSGCGYDEIISFSFMHPTAFDKLNLPQDSSLRTAIEVLNPITDDFPLLRTTLMAGVLENVVRNLSRKNEDLKIYEIGAVYLPETLPLTSLPQEPLMLCGALTGKREAMAWNQSREMCDFYDAKGTVEILLEKLGITGYDVSVADNASLHPGKSAVIAKDSDYLGVVGEVHPKVLDAFGVSRKVFIFEMSIAALVKHAVTIAKYQQLPKYPAIVRDLALVLPVSVPAAEVEKVIYNSAGELLSELRLFDVYVGEQVPQGSRSLAFSLTFRHAGRTLTDAEVEEYYKKIIVSLEQKLSAKLRI